jgi:hypothetical protein
VLRARGSTSACQNSTDDSFTICLVHVASGFISMTLPPGFSNTAHKCLDSKLWYHTGRLYRYCMYLTERCPSKFACPKGYFVTLHTVPDTKARQLPYRPRPYPQQESQDVRALGPHKRRGKLFTRQTSLSGPSLPFGQENFDGRYCIHSQPSSSSS